MLQYLASKIVYYQMNNPQANQQQSQYQSITKSESISQTKSIVSTSKLSNASSTIIDIVKCHLQGYGDVNEQEFQLLPNQPIIAKDSMVSEYSSYMNYHATIVPIGPNFQATIPPITTASKYSHRTQAKLKAIRQRKVHDPDIDSQFYLRYRQVVQDLFGQERTYQDVNQLRIIFGKRCGTYQDFQSYLKQAQIFEYWDDYFAAKDKLLSRIKRRKKKVK